jgi:predicted nucleic acid-binding protein
LIYADTSVVAAYYLPEALSGRVQSIFGEHDEVFISELVEVEFMAAVSLRLRLGDITPDEARQATDLFTAHADGGLYGKVRLAAGHYRTARDYIGRFDAPLKSPDALHIAAASQRRLPLVAADRQLVRNAEAFGVEAELIEA